MFKLLIITALVASIYAQMDEPNCDGVPPFTAVWIDNCPGGSPVGCTINFGETVVAKLTFTVPNAVPFPRVVAKRFDTETTEWVDHSVESNACLNIVGGESCPLKPNRDIVYEFSIDTGLYFEPGVAQGWLRINGKKGKGLACVKVMLNLA